MISNNSKRNIAKCLLCTAVVTQVSAVKAQACTQVCDTNAKSMQTYTKEQSIDDFLVVGKNVFACGMEYINAYQKCKETDRLTTPFLPVNSSPNNILERVSLKTGKVLQRRIYDENGNAYMDIDFMSHGATNSSACGEHKHIWINGKRSVAKPLTLDEKIKHVMIPRGYKGYEEVEMKNEKQSIPLSYNNFKALLIDNHEIRIDLLGSDYTIAYAKDKDGNPKYFLTRFNRNILMGVIEQRTFYSKQELLEKKMFYGKNFEEIWDRIEVREIY